MEQKFFRGTFQIKLDDKGRVSLPTSYKLSSLTCDESESQEYIFTNSMYEGKPCLDLYTKSEWSSLESRIAKLPQLKKEVQAFQRFYLAAALTTELDSQGRILIPKAMRDFAKLEGEVVLVGMGHKIEIWSHSYWDSVVNNLSEQFEANRQALSESEGAA